MNNKQLMALSDAAARSLGSGLENGGETWTGGHHHNTIRCLVDKGHLDLWAGGSVAHITDVGMLALEDQREQHRKRS